MNFLFCEFEILEKFAFCGFEIFKEISFLSGKGYPACGALGGRGSVTPCRKRRLCCRAELNGVPRLRGFSAGSSRWGLSQSGALLHCEVKIIKSVRKHSTLKGFSRGLGVVKGEGVAAAKKRSPSHLKEKIYLKI
ncbi:hypothetical protein [Campylobacter lanienae]|uniref:hypothetical protein n=1 Tax=Campylobacter lanienae TaxID=75658 RepID=UPI0015D878A8|nr:hypothetical protein [Campylobacter lanienae]